MKNVNQFLAAALAVALQSAAFAYDGTRASGPLEVDISVKDGERMIHLVNGNGRHRDDASFTEDFIPPVTDIRLKLRFGEKPESLRLEPEGAELAFEWRDGVAMVAIPRLDIRSAIVVTYPAAFPKDKIYVWGYTLDKTPTDCPFVFGKTGTSLEKAVSMFGAGKAMYMNSMFNRDYIVKNFPKWSKECFENCIDARLSDRHFEMLKGVPEIWCALEHRNRPESAKRIAGLSLKYPNIVGVNLDDFNNGNPDTAMSPAALKELKAMMRKINPKLKVAVVSYADAGQTCDLTPFRDELDVVSRWKWTAENAYWDTYKDDVAKLRRQVGPKVKIVHGLYLHDFGAGMESRNPLPLEIFKKSVRTATACVRDGSIDGIILPQVGWYSIPTHREHVNWLRDFLAGAVCRDKGQGADFRCEEVSAPGVFRRTGVAAQGDILPRRSADAVPAGVVSLAPSGVSSRLHGR
ncbi:MAG TPA: hypothetical protein PKI32_00095 [Opitutales bacterium]|nr:hypothetical protein [Opitutales bacterium]